MNEIHVIADINYGRAAPQHAIKTTSACLPCSSIKRLECRPGDAIRLLVLRSGRQASRWNQKGKLCVMLRLGTGSCHTHTHTRKHTLSCHAMSYRVMCL